MLEVSLTQSVVATEGTGLWATRPLSALVTQGMGVGDAATVPADEGLRDPEQFGFGLGFFVFFLLPPLTLCGVFSSQASEFPSELVSGDSKALCG